MQIESNPEGLAAPEFISFVDSEISIQTNDLKHLGIYKLRIKAEEVASKLVDTTVEFTIEVVCRITNLKPVFTDKTIYNLVYPIRSAPVTIAMPEYTW